MTTSNYVNPLSVLATAPSTTNSGTSKSSSSTGSWFQAMAQAWGQALDNQADIITQKSDVVSNGGGDSPSAITDLTTESLKMGFLSQGAQSSISTGGQALETMARKQ